jgi:hypothetical protein
MKKLIISLNPVNIFKRVISISKELYMFLLYIKALNEIEPELEESRIVKASKFSLIKAINLKPETLLLANKLESDMDKEDKKELHKLELSFVGREIAKYNDIFINGGIIELIKTKATRIKDNEYYGYMVTISYNWKKAKLYEIIRLLFQISIWVIILVNIPYINLYNYIMSRF